MATLATLPDLVILNIFGYLHLSNNEIHDKLRYCAISSRWRYLALPLVYNRIHINDCRRYQRSNKQPPPDIKWLSNISLFTNKELQRLVKKVQITADHSLEDFATMLGSLLDTINQDPVHWPEEYGPQLTGEIRDFPGYYSKTYIHQSLDNELLNKMRGVLDNFATKFVNISSFQLSSRKARGTAQQFTIQLLDAFNHRIQNLDLNLEFPWDLEYYPPNLKNLRYRFTKNTTTPLTKIRNLEKLESWCLEDIYDNVSWFDLVDIPTNSGEPLVLPNLKKISFRFYREDEYILLDHGATTQNLQLQFPQLTDLELTKHGKEGGLIFDPHIISSRLETVCLNVSWKELVMFSKLPISSIGWLDVQLDMSDIKNIDEFYRITNRLLGDIDNFRNYTRFYTVGTLELIDVGRIAWTNVTDFWLDRINTSILLDMLSKLPLLDSVVVTQLWYDSNYKTAEQQQLNSSLLKELTLFRLEGDGWSSDSGVEFITFLLGQHQSIDMLELPTDLRNQVVKAFQGTQWQHVKINDTSNEWD